MCINQEISINTFLFSAFAIGLALGNQVITIPSALYYLSFTSMQLLEFFAWRNINNKRAIHILSIIGLLLVTSQPLLYIIAYAKPSLKKNVLLVFYTLFAIATLTFLRSYYRVSFDMSKASNGHLAWHWLSYPLWIILIWAGFLLYVMIMNREYVKALAIFLLVGYIYMQYVKTDTWGSIWCWIANALSAILLYHVFSKSVGFGCKL